MGRPIFDGLQYLEAYGLHRKRMGPTGIQRWLEERHPDDPASLKTVKNWVRKFGEVKLDDPHLDDEFEWHKMDEHGLPWEASQYLLSVYRFHVRWVFNRPSFRYAVWWWRVHQAIPNESLYDIWGIAEHFVIRELSNMIMGTNLGFGDLQAWLAYQPWKDTRHGTIYDDDVKQGVIPPLSDSKGVVSLRDRLSNKPQAYAHVMHLFALDPRTPRSLPSRQCLPGLGFHETFAESRVEMTLEEFRREVEKLVETATSENDMEKEGE